jgi:hypothetical protein
MYTEGWNEALRYRGLFYEGGCQEKKLWPPGWEKTFFLTSPFIEQTPDRCSVSGSRAYPHFTSFTYLPQFFSVSK